MPHAGTGGVAPCAYCGAENIVGLDLRPSLDPARTEQHTFDAALKKRSKEKLLWTTLTIVAVVALAGWVVGTAFYIIGQTDILDVTPTPPPLPIATVAPRPAPAPQAPHAPAPALPGPKPAPGKTVAPRR